MLLMDLALDRVDFWKFWEFGDGSGDVHRFQGGEGGPELHRQWDDFNSPSKENLGIGC